MCFCASARMHAGEGEKRGEEGCLICEGWLLLALLPSSRKTACLRKILTSESSSSTSCNLASSCSSLRHTFSWAYRPSGITRCCPKPMRAVSTASATYDSPSPSNRCMGIRWSSARLTTLEQSKREGNTGLSWNTVKWEYTSHLVFYAKPPPWPQSRFLNPMTMAGGESALWLYLWPLKCNTKNLKSYFVVKDTKNTECYKQTRQHLFHSAQVNTYPVI